MKYPKRELAEKYLRACWIIKIRLISARRQLWGKQVSLIHLESSCLQIRKICEGTAQLCLIAAGIEYGDIPSKLRKSYEVGKIFKHLKSINHFKFICRATLSPLRPETTRRQWIHNVESPRSEDEDRVVTIFSRCGSVLHERSPFRQMPETSDEAMGTLSHDRNALRADHQWLWNFLWQHSIQLTSSPIFFVNLLKCEDLSGPRLVKQDNFVDEEISIEFDPNFIADFDVPVDWGKFNDW